MDDSQTKPHKIRMTDIAKACGVSSATVSYVLNERADQCISEETRRKILQYVNLTGYVSSRAARALSTGRHGIIGVFAPQAWLAPDRALRTTSLLDALSQSLERLDLQLTLLPSKCLTERSANVDAIIAVDLVSHEFQAIGNLNFCPLVCVDSISDDPTIFYQVNDDYSGVAASIRETLGVRRVFLLYDAFRNERITDRITSAFDFVCASDKPGIIELIRSEPKDTGYAALGLVNARTLRALGINPLTIVYKNQNADPPFIAMPMNKKAETIANLIQDILNHRFADDHDIIIK